MKELSGLCWTGFKSDRHLPRLWKLKVNSMVFFLNWCVFLKAGNCLSHSTKSDLRFMRGKNRSFYFFHFFIQKKKIILLENFLCVFPLCRHSGGPKESSVHAEIDFRRHKQCFFLACRCLLHCLWVLRYLLMRELMLLLADRGRGTETRWKTPETPKHNHIGIWGSWPPKWPPVILTSWISP